MKAVCAWCGADLGERPGRAETVTHGICRPCAAKELAKIGLILVRDDQGVARLQPAKARNDFFCASEVGVHPISARETTIGTKEAA